MIADTGVTIKAWWELQHRQQVRQSLSGYPAKVIWRTLGIGNRVVPGAVVLNIGVGFGYDTRELVKRGCRVHALDISQLALDSVSDVIEKGWLASQIADLPSDTYALVMSHDVAQHMSNRDLAIQMTNVVRSLAVDGIFAIQFAYLLGLKAEIPSEDESHIKGGAVVRTLEDFLLLASEAGGRVVACRKVGEYPKFNRGWYAVHIVKSGG